MTIDAYQSILEMPKFKKLNSWLEGMQIVSDLLPEETNRELERIREEFNELVSVAESFYAKLGDRHWVLHETLRSHELKDRILHQEPEQVERELIQHYKNPKNLNIYAYQLKRHADLLERWDQIERAKEDYLAGRYDTCALMLIAVLDGFVNDVDKNERRGLHARKPDEMVGFDCLGGHHLGLSNVIPVFQRSFHRRVDDEVYEVYRNGIVHGCIVHFNNDVVASKAWNYLFAVSDWASCPTEPEPQKELSLAEALIGYFEVRAQTQRINEWESYDENDLSYPYETSPSKEQASFFEAWQKGQVGLMLPYLFTRNASKNKAALVDLVKLEYIPIGILSWNISNCRHYAAAAAIVETEIETADGRFKIPFRWVRVSDGNRPACEWEPGRWAIAPNVPQKLRDVKPK